MGDDYLSEIAAENAHREHCLAQGLWVTRDGREIPIREMTDAHLANCIRMMKRGGAVGGMDGEFLDMMVDEVERRRKAVKR